MRFHSHLIEYECSHVHLWPTDRLRLCIFAISDDTAVQQTKLRLRHRLSRRTGKITWMISPKFTLWPYLFFMYESFSFFSFSRPFCRASKYFFALSSSILFTSLLYVLRKAWRSRDAEYWRCKCTQKMQSIKLSVPSTTDTSSRRMPSTLK